MGLKGLMSALGMNLFGMTALVVFFSAFVAILVWTFTRPRSEMEAHSRMPVDDED